MELPIIFPQCPICHGKKTVCREACANEPSIAPGTFVSLEKVITPIQDVNKITTPTVRAVVTHYDVCADCGHRYCTKAEVVSIPVGVRHRSGDAIRTLGFGGGQAR